MGDELASRALLIIVSEMRNVSKEGAKSDIA
jgi:hypothetical protein